MAAANTQADTQDQALTQAQTNKATQTDAACAWSGTATEYDNMGRVLRTSQPFCAANAGGGAPGNDWTVPTYDDLGRVVEVKTPDNAKVLTSYDLLTTGNLLARVDEPTAAGLGLATAPNQPTHYTSDIQGNLRKVDQGGQLRYFAYDSLSRLLYARNPEQSANPGLSYTDPQTGNSGWSMGYTYDAGGNLLTRTDARNVVATYTYDNLNRNTVTTYSDTTPQVKRFYDGFQNGDQNQPYSKGALWRTETANNSQVTVSNFDNLSRPRTLTQAFYANGGWNYSYATKREYDLTGAVTKQTYPSGHEVNYSYDAVKRLSVASGNLGEGVYRNYFDAPRFDERGLMVEEKYGTQTPLYHRMSYNVRGQMAETQLGTGTGANAWNRGRLQNYYTQDIANGATTGTDNNGNLRHQKITLPDGSYWQQDYVYDELNRLASASEARFNSSQNGATFSQNFSYDRWGNRLVSQQSGMLNAPTNFEIETATNRLCAPGDANLSDPNRLMRYDKAGNLWQDRHNPQTTNGDGFRNYDAENRMTAAQGVNGIWQNYTYDGDGRRIIRQVNGVDTWQVYGFGGELIAEYSAQFAAFIPQKEYGYAGGKMLVTAANGDEQRLTTWVNNLYLHTYGALPAATEIQAKVNALATAGGNANPLIFTQTAQAQATELFTSTTYANRNQNNHANFVRDLYQAYLQRPGEPGGVEYWAEVITYGYATREDVRLAFAAAAGEFGIRLNDLRGNNATDNTRTDQFVNYLYLGALNRFADAGAMTNLRSGFDTASAKGQSDVVAYAKVFAKGLFNSGEYLGRGQSQSQFVRDLYLAFLRHEPDSNGWAYWTDEVGANWQNKQAVMDAFANTAAFETQAATLYREVLWLIGDHLGTPRFIAERTVKLRESNDGTLCRLEKH